MEVFFSLNLTEGKTYSLFSLLSLCDLFSLMQPEPRGLAEASRKVTTAAKREAKARSEKKLSIIGSKYN